MQNQNKTIHSGPADSGRRGDQSGGGNTQAMVDLYREATTFLQDTDLEDAVDMLLISYTNIFLTKSEALYTDQYQRDYYSLISRLVPFLMRMKLSIGKCSKVI